MQCHKLLWYMANAKSLIPVPKESLQASFDQGHAFGSRAKDLFPKGCEVDWNGAFNAGLAHTQALIRRRVPIFEAGGSCNGVHARADVLDPVENGEWNLIEVKNSEEVKPVFCMDVAFQRYCFRSAGLPIRHCFILTPENKESSSERDSSVIWTDVTGVVDDFADGLEERIKALRNIADQPTCPNVATGEHCTFPYLCQMYELCHTTDEGCP